MRSTVKTNNSNVSPRKTRSMVHVSHATRQVSSSRGEPRYEGYDIRGRSRSDSRTTPLWRCRSTEPIQPPNRCLDEHEGHRNGDQEGERGLRAEDFVTRDRHDESEDAPEPGEGQHGKQVAVRTVSLSSMIHAPNVPRARS